MNRNVRKSIYDSFRSIPRVSGNLWINICLGIAATSLRGHIGWVWGCKSFSLDVETEHGIDQIWCTDRSNHNDQYVLLIGMYGGQKHHIGS